MTRQLFCFFQFGGGNEWFCNQLCPYCYGGTKRMVHLWNGNIKKWTEAFERLDRDRENSGIYFNLTYGESMIMKGFPEVVEMIGAHENWETSLITNLSVSPKRLIESKLGQDRRVYVHASWHPLGGPAANWERFTKHLLMLQEAEIPTIVMYLFYPPQIERWKTYWKWLDEHNFRTCVRRYVGRYGGIASKLPRGRGIMARLEGSLYPQGYSRQVRDFIRAYLQPKTARYGFDLASPEGKLCTAGKDMILVHYDGQVSYCADVPDANLGNIFDPEFKLNDNLTRCQSMLCGGDYGMFHLQDAEFGPNPERLWSDCFVAQSEHITGGGKDPVYYPNRVEMEKWLLS